MKNLAPGLKKPANPRSLFQAGFNLILRMCPLFFAVIAVASASAATVAVGTCMPKLVSFDSLTDAVQGVPPGGTILVCPGVYAEQITINRSLTLKGVSSGNSGNPVIVPPPSGLVANATAFSEPVSFFSPGFPFAAQVIIEGGADVTLSNIAVDATGFNIPTCTPFVVGVLVQNSSATLHEMVVKNQLQKGPSPCFSLGAGGTAVLAQNASTNPTTVKIENSSFLNNGEGYESDGAGNTSTLIDNSFAGNPATNGNAISIFNGSSTIEGNSISNLTFPALAPNDPFRAAFGILLTCVPNGKIANNTIATSQVGIISARSGSCIPTDLSIVGNRVSDSQFYGIYLSSTNGLVRGNEVRTSGIAIRTDPKAGGNTIKDNVINDACAAFSSDPATPATKIDDNTVANAVNLALVNTTALCP